MLFPLSLSCVEERCAQVNQLSTLANEVTRVSLEVGTEGILGGQAYVPDVQGMWKVRFPLSPPPLLSPPPPPSFSAQERLM